MRFPFIGERKPPRPGVPHLSSASAALPVGPGARAAARAEIYRLHGNTALTGEDVVLAVGQYKIADYFYDKLRSNQINGKELQQIEKNLEDFLALACQPHLLKAGAEKILADAKKFAHFHAGIFALARDDFEGAKTHFSKAKAKTKEEAYDNNWGIEAKPMSKLLKSDRSGEAARSLNYFFRLKERLVPAIVSPAVKEENKRTVVIDLKQLPVITAPKPPASPKPSAPQTTPGSPLPPGKR